MSETTKRSVCLLSRMWERKEGADYHGTGTDAVCPIYGIRLDDGIVYQAVHKI